MTGQQFFSVMLNGMRYQAAQQLFIAVMRHVL